MKAAGEHSDLSRIGAPAVDHQATREPIEIVRVGDAEHPRFVHARDVVARMREPRRQIAVVGQQEQAFRIEVEPADRVDVLADAAQKVDDCRPLLRIRSRRHVTAGLVQQQIPVLLSFDAPAVDTNVVVRGVGLGSQLAHRGAVY